MKKVLFILTAVPFFINGMEDDPKSLESGSTRSDTSLASQHDIKKQSFIKRIIPSKKTCRQALTYLTGAAVVSGLAAGGYYLWNGCGDVKDGCDQMKDACSEMQSACNNCTAYFEQAEQVYEKIKPQLEEVYEFFVKYILPHAKDPSAFLNNLETAFAQIPEEAYAAFENKSTEVTEQAAANAQATGNYFVQGLRNYFNAANNYQPEL